MEQPNTQTPADEREALSALIAAVDAELSESWECASYHPRLRPALEAARKIALQSARSGQSDAKPTFVYTLITYRPDGIDTCRNCVMGTSPSDFDLKVFDDRDKLVAAWAHAAAYAPDGREYSEPEFTLLLNGLDYDNEPSHRTEGTPRDPVTGDLWTEIEREQIRVLVEAETKRLKALRLEAEQAAQKKARRDEEDRREAAERQQLATLQKKYGV